jgi:hypothetical protein
LLGALAARFGEQALLGPFQREPLVVEQRLDADDEVEVTPAVDPLPRGVLLGTQQLELRLPVPEDVGGNPRDRLDFSDAVVELLGDVRQTAG